MECYHRPSIWQCLVRTNAAVETEARARVLRDFDNSIISGFQLATLSGPMCEEPVMGVCFSMERWDILSSALPKHLDRLKQDCLSHMAASDSKVEKSPKKCEQAEDEEVGQTTAICSHDMTSADCYGPVSGQLIAAMKEACRHAFQAQPQRLMAAMYTCEIMATAEVLGMKELPANFCHTKKYLLREPSKRIKQKDHSYPRLKSDDLI